MPYECQILTLKEATVRPLCVKLTRLGATANLSLIAAVTLSPQQQRNTPFWHPMGSHMKQLHKACRYLFCSSFKWIKMIIVLVDVIPSKIYINGDKLTNNSRSYLTNKLIRQRVGDGREMFQMAKKKKKQNSASIHKKDHAKIRSILVKIKPQSKVCESKGMHASWRKCRVHLTTASSEQNKNISLEKSQQGEQDAITLLFVFEKESQQQQN